MIFTLFNIFVPSVILAGSYLIFRTDRAWDTVTTLVGAVLVVPKVSAKRALQRGP